MSTVSKLEVFTEPTTYVVTCIPPEFDHPEARRHFTITVERRAPDRWAVCNQMGECISRSGTWSWERQPSSRTDRYKASHRFPLPEALALAAKAARKITIMGRTVQDVLDGKWR